jgi:hypothetical protein
MGNYHARFLGGWARATAPGYPPIGMVNKCELVIKIVICNKRKWLALSRLNQKVLDEGGTPGNYVFRDPHASRSKADT